MFIGPEKANILIFQSPRLWKSKLDVIIWQTLRIDSPKDGICVLEKEIINFRNINEIFFFHGVTRLSSKVYLR